MSQQIKFRAIDQFSDDFVFGQGFFVDSDNEQGYITTGVERHHCIKKDTINQFTMLNDVENVEIFQNDIVEFTYLNEYKVVGIVSLNKFGHSEIQAVKVTKSGIDSRMDFKNGLTFHIENATKGKVIGNVYQNFELIS